METGFHSCHVCHSEVFGPTAFAEGCCYAKLNNSISSITAGISKKTLTSLQRPVAHTNAHLYSFFPNEIALWNDLAPSVRTNECIFLNALYIPLYITSHLSCFLNVCVLSFNLKFNGCIVSHLIAIYVSLHYITMQNYNYIQKKHTHSLYICHLVLRMSRKHMA